MPVWLADDNRAIFKKRLHYWNTSLQVFVNLLLLHKYKGVDKEILDGIQMQRGLHGWMDGRIGYYPTQETMGWVTTLFEMRIMVMASLIGHQNP